VALATAVAEGDQLGVTFGARTRDQLFESRVRFVSVGQGAADERAGFLEVLAFEVGAYLSARRRYSALRYAAPISYAA
jgi:hypothetical protein